MPSVQTSVASAALAGVLALASASGSMLLAGGVALVLLIFTLGAVRSAPVTSVRPMAWLALVAGLVALAWTQLADTPDLTPMVAVLGPVLVAAVVVELLRRDGRAHLTVSLSVAVSACVLAVLPVAWVALRAAPEGASSVGLAMLGVGLVSLAEALPLSRATCRVLGVAITSIAAAALVILVDGFGQEVPAVSAVVVAAFAGLMAAVSMAVVDRMEAELPPVEAQAVPVPGDSDADRLGDGRRVGVEATATAAYANRSDGAAALVPLRITLPFIAAAPAVYVLGRILVG